jgi:hypothetical protein
LISAENGTWKLELVRNNFTAPEADAILNIPLRRGGGDDVWAWGLEKTGIYSVKTSQRALMTCNELSTLAEWTVFRSMHKRVE